MFLKYVSDLYGCRSWLLTTEKSQRYSLYFPISYKFEDIKNQIEIDEWEVDVEKMKRRNTYR